MSVSKKSWFASCTSKSRNTPRAKPPRRRFHLECEALEARTVPTVAVAFNANQFFARNAWDYLAETFQFTNAQVSNGSNIVTLNNHNTSPMHVGDYVTITAGSNTFSSTITAITPNTSIQLFDASTFDSTSATVTDGPPAPGSDLANRQNAETAGQFPVTLVDTNVALSPQQVTVGVTNGSNVVTTTNTSGLNIGQFVQVSDGTTTLYSVINQLSMNSTVTLDDVWTGSTGTSATLSVLKTYGSQFLTLCWDLKNFLQSSTDGFNTNIFQVTPIPTPSLTPTLSPAALPNAAARIAYLYDTFGTTPIPNDSGTNSPAQAVGLQVAIWELEYGNTFTLSQVLQTSPGNTNSVTQELNAINSFATNFVNESATMLSQHVTFLQANGTSIQGGDQGVLVTPAITTSQQPASASVGSTIADKATVTGGFMPTGTVTFNLYSSATEQDSSTLLFTDTEPLVGGMATAAGYTATATGTDYWVATYNGDSNNNPVSSGPTAEPVTITSAGPSITTTPSTTRLTAPDVDVLKTPDQTTIQAGQQAGFTIRVYNEGTATATGVTVNDPLPAGIGNDINWMIDATAAGTNPTYFTITGAVGSQVLTLSSIFNGPPTNDSLAPGQSISVHIVGLTTTNDVDPPAGPPRSAPAILPGTELTSSGTVAVDNGHQNVTPESQAPSRPEITVTNLSFKVQPGYMILLENSIDTSIPEAGPPPGKGVSGVPSAIEFARVADWSDVAVFANITDSTGTHGVVYWCSAAENVSNQDTGTPLDTILANMGSSNPGLAAPKATDNVVFLVEREAGRSGDNNPSQLSGGNGGGQSNPNNSYLTNNITYNTHSDPPGPTPSMVFTGTLTNTVTVNAANEPAAEMNDHATATITITTATTSVLPDVDVVKIPDQTSIVPGATAGFTVVIYNEGGLTASGVTLSDPLPAGANNDINWKIDTSTGNFAAFAITGPVGSQTLSLNPNTSLSAGGSLTVHITGQTSAADTGTLGNLATVNASNEAVSESNATAAANITVGANTAGSAVLNDTADLEGGNNPTGTITFTLYAPDNSVAFTQVVPVSHGDGLYSTSNTAVATQGGTYQWVAAYSGDANNQPVSSKKGDEPVVVTGSPDVDVLKTPDQATIIAGTQAGFTVTVFNEGNATATGVTLTDPLPAGLGNDINWMIDTTAAGTNPTYFTITGAVGSQVLTLSTSFNAPPSNDSLAPGQSISVHIVGMTTANDVPSPSSSPTPAPAILPGTELTSSGTVAVDNGHQNVTPESQAPSRPEMTITDLSFKVQPGFMVLLEQTIDTTVPEAGPSPGKGVTGVGSVTEFGRPQDWSDVAIFVNITDSTGTHGRVYWMSAPEDANNQDTGTPLDNILANLGPANPGLSVPTLANTVFLVEREAGRSGDNNPAQLAGKKGGGQSNPNNSYLTGNITYNLHSDPPAAIPVVTTGQLTNTATVTASNESGAEKTDTSTATITITAAVPRLLPDVDVKKVADQPIVNAGATAGFTVTISNEGAATATTLTLSDLLPAGVGNDINWKIDSTTGNPTAFTITGPVGSQTLSLNSGTSLAPGACLEVHVTGLTSTLDAPAPGYASTLTDVASVNAGNEVTTDQNDGWISDLTISIPVARGDSATMAFWQKWNGALIQSLNGGPNATNLSQWLVANFPNLYGPGAGAHSMDPGGVYLTNAQVAQSFINNFYVNGSSGKPGAADANVLATALAVYATSSSLAGGNYAASYGLNMSPGGVGSHTYNVGTSGTTFDVPNNSTQTIMDLLWDTDMLASSTGVIANAATVNTVFSAINSIGHVNATLSNSGAGYAPNQVRTAYGINSLTLDGTGQTIAVVDAFDTPTIFQALDVFDQQFGTTSTGQSLYQQYGPASSFLTVLNQDGQAGPLPMVDPSGAGTNNWEGETELDVEWIHAVAPGAQIILVEANSPTLADLMAAVGSAAQQPGVSVVSMSWGFTEGLAVVAQDEALYDQVLTTPAGHQGVTFVASTGDYGTADPEYPAFSPNVVAVGGTSLYLNADNSYNSETGWGYNAARLGGLFVGTGGGVSQFEAEPAWQAQVQGSGYRTTPDVSLIADPGTGVWIADPYNLDPTNPWEVVGGTSLSAPGWAGLIALANQGRVAAGKSTFEGSGLSAQQALYSVPTGDFTDITSGTNGGFTAGIGYDVVTGLGSPQVASLVPDLINYSGGALTSNTGSPTYLSGYQPAGPGASGSTGVMNFSVFSFETAASLVPARGNGGATYLSGGASGSAGVINPSVFSFETAASLVPAKLSAPQERPITPVPTFAWLQVPAFSSFAEGGSQTAWSQPVGSSSTQRQTNGIFFIAGVRNRLSGDSGLPASSWATVLGESDPWMPGLDEAQAVYQQLRTPSSNALDRVFSSELPPRRVVIPAAAEVDDSSSADTSPSTLNYGWYQVEMAADETDGGC